MNAAVHHARHHSRHVAAAATWNQTRFATAVLKSRGLRTRREYAALIGVTEQTVLNWESGRCKPAKAAQKDALEQQGIPRKLLK